jgi:hypothetical protein
MAGMFLIVLAAAAGLVLLANEKNIRAADRKAAEAVTQHQTASIVLNQDSKSCQVKSFDNRTGQISDANMPCPDGGLPDATGSSTGQGTAHTINAISKSFRSQ